MCLDIRKFARAASVYVCGMCAVWVACLRKRRKNDRECAKARTVHIHRSYTSRHICINLAQIKQQLHIWKLYIDGDQHRLRRQSMLKSFRFCWKTKRFQQKCIQKWRAFSGFRGNVAQDSIVFRLRDQDLLYIILALKHAFFIKYYSNITSKKKVCFLPNNLILK